MKKIVVKLMLLLLITSCIMMLTASLFKLGLYDHVYSKLATPKATSMIVGTSRAAQGILPHVLNKELNDLKNKPKIINFAFTEVQSPYGPSYLNLIKKKLVDTTSTGVFIVAVDPWAISTIFKYEKSLSTLRENNTFINDVKYVDVHPNLEYILKYSSGPFYKLMLPYTRTKLHPNGWLEISISRDTAEYRSVLSKKLKIYEHHVISGGLSMIRIESLKSTIKLLKMHGDVYLVRIPVAKEMADLEIRSFPEFDSLVSQISSDLDAPYLNYIFESSRYQTTDGYHLEKESGKVFSERLAHDILVIGNKSTVGVLN